MARLVRLGPTALLYSHKKEWIGGEKERAGTMLDDSCEGSATTFCGLSAWRKIVRALQEDLLPGGGSSPPGRDSQPAAVVVL
jgi:hypothetical protein